MLAQLSTRSSALRGIGKMRADLEKTLWRKTFSAAWKCPPLKPKQGLNGPPTFFILFGGSSAHVLSDLFYALRACAPARLADSQSVSHSYQFRQGLGLHLTHDLPAMDANRDFACATEHSCVPSPHPATLRSMPSSNFSRHRSYLWASSNFSKTSFITIVVIPPLPSRSRRFPPLP
jgi:hypothetical protein